jgi:micrococcal nuclease
MPRHPRTKPIVLLFSLLVAIIVLAIPLAKHIDHPQGQARSVTVLPSTQQTQDQLFFRVERAVDGDTLKLDNGERVRLIGVDTPETHENPKLRRDAARTGEDVQTILNMGRQAHDFTRKIVEGQEVRLEFDVQPRDKYGRLLAYVYLSDGTFLNEEIIKNGYAYPMTIPPNVHHAEGFKTLFEQAQAQHMGLWGRARK